MPLDGLLRLLHCPELGQAEGVNPVLLLYLVKRLEEHVELAAVAPGRQLEEGWPRFGRTFC